MRRTIKKIVLSVVALIILFGVAGVLYTLLTDGSPPKSATPKPPKQPAELSVQPTQPAANAKEGAAVETVTSPVKPGDNSSITVATNAGSACTITVTYNGVASKDSGLVPKQADAYGNVTWTWTVPPTTPLGTWPISVTCVYHGRSAVVDSNLEVVRQT